jgi:hypothetical protein
MRPPPGEPATQLPREDLEALAGLLRRRHATISDTAWRDRDPDGHLRALQEVSEAIGGLAAVLRGNVPFQLGHFLERCSFDKALAYIEAALRKPS